MFTINQKTKYMSLTRGDNLTLEFDLWNDATNEPYELQNGDKVMFRMLVGRGEYIEKECDIDLVLSPSSVVLELVPDDTIGLNLNQYPYEVEVVTNTGKHFTCIADSIFEITRELEEHNE